MCTLYLISNTLCKSFHYLYLLIAIPKSSSKIRISYFKRIWNFKITNIVYLTLNVFNVNNTSRSNRGFKNHNVDHKSVEHIMCLFLLLISFDGKAASLLSCLNCRSRHCSNSLKIIFTYFFLSMLSFHLLFPQNLKVSADSAATQIVFILGLQYPLLHLKMCQSFPSLLGFMVLDL